MTYQEINQCKSIENLPNEIFKDIPGYEDLYQISNLGRVKSLLRIKTNLSNNQYCTFLCVREFKEKILKNKKETNGYLRVSLCKNNKNSLHSIHRLVMLAFKGESNLTVNHIDCNKENNRLDNLEYCSIQENIMKATQKGLNNKFFNSKKKKIKQYDLQGNFIKEYNSITEAEQQIKVKRENIYYYLNKGKNSKNKKFIWKYS